jgi:hypothetical protein
LDGSDAYQSIVGLVALEGTVLAVEGTLAPTPQTHGTTTSLQDTHINSIIRNMRQQAR